MATPTQALSTYVYPGSDEFVKQEVERLCPILKLSDEVLLHIFKLIEDPSDLDSIPFVCRYWREIAEDNSLWSETRLIKIFLSPEDIERQGLKQRDFFK